MDTQGKDAGTCQRCEKLFGTGSWCETCGLNCTAGVETGLDAARAIVA